MRKPISKVGPLFVFSDSTGKTGLNVVNRALGQFDPQGVTVERFGSLNTISAIEERIRHAASVHAAVFYTFVRDDLRKAIKDLGRSHRVHVVDLIGHVVDEIEVHCHKKAAHVPGRTIHLDESAIGDALKYVMDTDDCRNERLVPACDLVIVGLSCLGKSPIAVRLALEHSLRAANWPFSFDSEGEIVVPDFIRVRPRQVFCLEMDSRALQIRRQHRSERNAFKSSDYIDLEVIDRESQAVHVAARRYCWCIVDVTDKGIEESADEIFRAYVDRVRPLKVGI